MSDAPPPSGSLPESDLALLASKHLSALPRIEIAPAISRRKLAAARRLHHENVGQREPIIVLFDATFLGGGDEGFLATPESFCWKNWLEHSRAVRWMELANLPIDLVGSEIRIGGGRVQVPWGEGANVRVRDFLLACSARMLPATAPYREVSANKGPTRLSDAILLAARRELGEKDWIHYSPSVPAKKITAVFGAHEKHLGRGEQILVLYDDTVFGAGNDGFVLTERGVFWRNFLGSAEMIEWAQLSPEHLVLKGGLLSMEPVRTGAQPRCLDVRMHSEMPPAVGRALAEVARVVRAFTFVPRGVGLAPPQP